MKLLTKINIRYITWSFVVMAISGVAIYFILSVVINRQIDEQLTGILLQVELQMETDSKPSFLEPFSEISTTSSKTEQTVLKDTLILNEQENEWEEFRQIIAIKKVNGEYYRIALLKSKIESEDLLETLALVTILAMLILTLTLMVVNRKVAHSVWKGFYFNLGQLKTFSLLKQETLHLQSSNIQEFSELNQILEKLTKQVITDYQNLKQFTENASHEMQTPLAVIRSKLETILNEPGLSEKQTGLIHAAFSSANHLARLNKSLILLAKLDNKQFADTSEISLQELIKEKINDWQELMELKQIQLKTNFQKDILFRMSPELAEILISNLLSNAINHNVKDGLLNIETNKNQLIISNMGEKELSNPKDIFNRFYKENPSSQSVGLGLAIVKKICDLYEIEIFYGYLENRHCFTLQFNL
jgi:signal transduction histidine kinase